MMNICWCGNKNLEYYNDDYCVCNECKTLVSKFDFDNSITNVEDEEKSLYGENYWADYMLKLTGLKSVDEMIDYFLSERSIYWLKYLLKFRLPSAKVLEIGCGLGQYSYLLMQSGYSVTATELSENVCNYIRENLFIDIKCGDLSVINGIFDIIIANDVVEHILDIETFLKQINEVFDDNGLLVLQLPCYNPNYSYDEVVLKEMKFINLLTPDQHIYLYSKESIENLLKKHGFDYINYETPIFGEDYDMFLFASRKPLNINNDEKIDKKLNSLTNGRIIKSLINLYNDKEKNLSTINQINYQLIESNQRLIVYDKQLIESNQRLADADKLLTEKNYKLRETENKLRDAENNLLSLLNSSSWRLTKPLRFFGRLVKNILLNK